MLNTINPNMPSYLTTTDPNSTHKISTDDMILLVGMESMKACENKVQAYYSQVDQVTKMIKNISKAMEEAAKQLKNGGSLKDVKFQYVDADGKTREMDTKTFLEQCGVTCPEPHLPKFLQDILQQQFPVSYFCDIDF